MITRNDLRIIEEHMNYVKPHQEYMEFPVSHEALKQWERDIESLSHALALINPNFDKQKYMDGCHRGIHENNSISGG